MLAETLAPQECQGPSSASLIVDVVVQMARSVQVLTLPMPVHVDDCGLIGPEQGAVDREMLAFHIWAEEVCGIVFKAIKDRPAAQLQFFLGFWWCARSQTRTLDWARVVLYDDMLRVMLSQSSLTLTAQLVFLFPSHRGTSLPPSCSRSSSASLSSLGFASALGVRIPQCVPCIASSRL